MFPVLGIGRRWEGDDARPCVCIRLKPGDLIGEK